MLGVGNLQGPYFRTVPLLSRLQASFTWGSSVELNPITVLIGLDFGGFCHSVRRPQELRLQRVPAIHHMEAGHQGCHVGYRVAFLVYA